MASRWQTFTPGQTLEAADLNDSLNPHTADHIPRATATGNIAPTQNHTGSYVKRTITFPAGRFSKPPLVFCQSNGGAAGGSNKVIISVGTVTPTTADIYFYPIAGQTFALSDWAGCYWHAIQMEA